MERCSGNGNVGNEGVWFREYGLFLSLSPVLLIILNLGTDQSATIIGTDQSVMIVDEPQSTEEIKTDDQPHRKLMPGSFHWDEEEKLLTQGQTVGDDQQLREQLLTSSTSTSTSTPPPPWKDMLRKFRLA